MVVHPALTIRLKLIGTLLLIPVSAYGQIAPTPDPGAAESRYSLENESTAERFKQLAQFTLNDQKAIWTSPFHIHKKDAKWWLLFGAATGALVATDQHLVNQLPNSKTQVSVGKDISRLGAGYTIFPIAGAFYAVGALTGDSKAEATGLLGLEALVDGTLEVTAIKYAVGRDRPLQGDGDFGHYLHQSFPSGHSVLAWSLASVVGHQYSDHKWVPILVYTLATAVSASRLTARQHFPSDVVAGGAMGYFTGRFVYNRHREVPEGSKKAWMHPHVSPAMQPGSYGAALAWN